MKVEFDYPEDEVIIKYIYAPSMMGGPAYKHLPEDDPSRPWSVYVKSVKSPTYYGAHGHGMNPQRAVDDAVRQVREYLVRNPQGAYNTNVPKIDLDLTGIFDDL